MKKVAIVVQRYGVEVVGGAEGLARDVAEKMNDIWDVTVLTTCARDYRTWANSYAEGEEVINSVRVKRFPVVKPRDFVAYAKQSYQREINAYRLTEAEELAHFQEQGPETPALINYIESHRDTYDVFLFFTYLYYTSVFGIPKVADKAYLVTTVHDEPPFYFIRQYAPIFNSLRGIIYLAEEELELIEKVYAPPASCRRIKGGYGVAKPFNFTSEREKELREKFKFITDGPFYLYLGRASLTKRCHELVDSFVQLTGDYHLPVKLIFAGSLDLQLPEDRSDILPIGFVTEEEKSFLIRESLCVINPSSLESLSMVVLEAWQHNRPVIVNGHCSVMRGLCDRSRGGVYYFSLPMLKGLMAWMYYNHDLRLRLGRNGNQFVISEFDWGRIKSRLIKEVQ